MLAYGNDDLQLLHVRDNVTGEYASKEDLQRLATEYGVSLSKHSELSHRIDNALFMHNSKLHELDVKKFLEQLMEETEGVEGVVIQFKNGDMVKLKTKWYLERHRAMTFLRERDIALMVLRESLDDLKALLVGEGANIAEILVIEARVVHELNEIQKSVEGAYEAYKDLDRKTFALRFQNGEHAHKHFPLLMQKFSGKEPDYKGYFERKFLPEFPLRQLNLVQSVAEVE